MLLVFSFNCFKWKTIILFYKHRAFWWICIF